MAHAIGRGRLHPGQLPGVAACWVIIAALGACQPDARQATGAPTQNEDPIAVPSLTTPATGPAPIAPPAVKLEAPPAPPAAPAPELIALQVPGYRDAVVGLPAGASPPRPVVVAVHGNYDRVEPFCETFTQVSSQWAFVLCPRGQPRVDAGTRADRWTFGWNGRDLEREIDAGLKALKQRYGAQVSDGPMVFAGFSLGAILGADIVLWKAKRYTRAILVEGGTANWSLSTAKTFARGGGQRMMFACGQEQCVKDTRVGLYWLELAGVEARTAYAGTIGHTYEGIVAEEMTRQWAWLTEGDPRWPSAQGSAGPLARREPPREP
ncbi:MAG: hypothetical protein HY898_34700 [Deltaproteobacteria bacterium]|nr:hypothetical protein [Deltaproteobacteria bacterium]